MMPLPPSNPPITRTHVVGPYTVVKGKLDIQDYREAYVIGPIGGRQAPIASFWSFAEALIWAKANS